MGCVYKQISSLHAYKMFLERLLCVYLSLVCTLVQPRSIFAFNNSCVCECYYFVTFFLVLKY